MPLSLNDLKKQMDDEMNKTLKSFQGNLAKVRTGRATAAILDGIVADYYGTPTPIKQLGQISTPEARLLQIQPFDKTAIGAIEKALFAANLGVTPGNDGNVIRLTFPALTEQKRKDLVKEVKKLGEDAKVILRNVRRDKNELIKKGEKAKEISEDDSKKWQTEVQTITDNFTKKIDTFLTDKEKELMTV